MMNESHYYIMKFLVIFLVLVGFVASTPQVSACSCAAEWNIEDDFMEKDSVIFSGTVTEIKEQQRNFLLTLEVDQSWKGMPSDVNDINIMTSKSSASCGYNFEEQQDYLVVAHGPWDQTPWVSICSSTTSLDSAHEQISFLNKQTKTVLDRSSPEYVPPLKQLQSGINYNDIRCRDNKVLVLKQSDEFASCVYPETVMKLFARGWALPESPIADTNTLQQESKLIKITGIIDRFDTMEGFEYQLIPLHEELPRIAYTGYDTVNLLSTKDTVHQFIRDIDGDLVRVHGSFILNDEGEYQRHFSGFPIIPAEKLEKISENLDLEHTINGAEIISITKLQETNAVNIVLDESNGGSLTITIPREILDATIGAEDDSFFVLIDGKEIPYTETAKETRRTLTIDFEKDTRIIEIIGTVAI